MLARLRGLGGRLEQGVSVTDIMLDGTRAVGVTAEVSLPCAYFPTYFQTS